MVFIVLGFDFWIFYGFIIILINIFTFLIDFIVFRFLIFCLLLRLSGDCKQQAALTFPSGLIELLFYSTGLIIIFLRLLPFNKCTNLLVVADVGSCSDPTRPATDGLLHRVHQHLHACTQTQKTY